MTLQAIETTYQGFRFRSRLEARYAIMLDRLDYPYLYEFEGITLCNGEKYLPDFYLPDLDSWAEVKPKYPDEDELVLCRMLVWESRQTCILFIGNPSEGPYETIERWDDELIHSETWLADYLDMSAAIRAARSARFEYGEQP